LQIDIPINFREGKPSDSAFIFSSWLASYRNAMRAMPRSYYYAGQHSRIESLLARSRCVVAVPTDDPDLIAAYLVFNHLAVHWIYTRQSMRKMGIGSAMLNFLVLEPFFYTHRTTSWLDHRRGTYNPYLLDIK